MFNNYIITQDVEEVFLSWADTILKHMDVVPLEVLVARAMVVEEGINTIGDMIDVTYVHNMLNTYISVYNKSLELNEEQKAKRVYIPSVKKLLSQGEKDIELYPFTRPLRSVINHMIDSVDKNHYSTITLCDFFISIFTEPKSYSARLLLSLGVNVDKLKIRREEIQAEYKNIKKESYLKKLRHPKLRREESRIAFDKIMDEFMGITDGAQKGKRSQNIRMLKTYGKDLTELAREGKIDPVIGRNEEILRVCEILSRRKKNNPILVGEVGVGKTAIAEGLALEIANKNVPKSLMECQIYSIELSSMVAGTKYRGEFEERLKRIIEEVQKEKDIIIFIDEIHSIIGAGDKRGGLDAANILKPALANGTLRCIGATTFSEYKSLFEIDRALSRRFTKVDIKEPSLESNYKILEGLAKFYEEFHNVKYDKEALKSCVDLSHRYINDRFLPDKAIDLLDEVGANLRLNNQSEETINVTLEDVENIISKHVHIPKSKISSTQSDMLKNLESNLKSRIFAQDEALHSVVKVIKKNKAGLGALTRPIGSFVFTGPSGVGKTELCRELANLLGIELVRFDMSEYMEAHSVSRLIGAPAGYVGYDNGGLLVDAVRKTPHCVLLFDEIEKAHGDIYNILLQILDNASLTDNMGNRADFKNAIIILTSNAGSKENDMLGFNSNTQEKTLNAIKDIFSPELRSRIDAVIPFSSLSKVEFAKIVDKNISDLNLTLKEKNISLSLAKNVAQKIIDSSMDSALGAREIRKIIDTLILTPLSDEILFGALKDSKNSDKMLKVKATLLKNEIHLKVENHAKSN